MVLSPRHYGRRSGSRAATSRRTGAGSVAQRQDPRRRLWVATVGGPVASKAAADGGGPAAPRAAGSSARSSRRWAVWGTRTQGSLEWRKSRAKVESPHRERAPRTRRPVIFTAAASSGGHFSPAKTTAHLPGGRLVGKVLLDS